MNVGTAQSDRIVARLNPLLIGAQCEPAVRGMAETEACLNPLLIGAQCELTPGRESSVVERLNPLLIGAQCEPG